MNAFIDNYFSIGTPQGHSILLYITGLANKLYKELLYETEIFISSLGLNCFYQWDVIDLC